jgi:hypothetical protein
MSGFVVDSRTLVAVRDTLGRLNDQLVGMHTVIWQQWGTLGGRALESELEHFCGTWHYGVAELGDQLQDLTRRLSEAAAAYDRIEQRITHASGGSGSSGGAAPSPPAGSGHTSANTHHTTAKHTNDKAHSKHAHATHHPASGGMGGTRSTHYSGGAGLVSGPGSTGGAGHTGDKHRGDDKHPGVGSGTTVIGGGSEHGGTNHAGGADHNGGGDKHPGEGSGTTVIGGGPTRSSVSGTGTGTSTIDEKIHKAEERQRAELAAVLKTVKD